MIETIGSSISAFISHSGYMGVFLLMTVESALIPIPSEVTMPFSGFLSSIGQFNFFVVIFIGALGNLFGSYIAYFLGRWGQDTFVRQFIKKYGKYILVSEHEFDRSERWFRKYGEVIVFVSRLLPAVRTYISLPSGIAQMQPLKFGLYTFIGSLLWSALLTYVGFILGHNWSRIGPYFHTFDAIIGLFIMVVIFFFVYHKIRRRKHTDAAK